MARTIAFPRLLPAMAGVLIVAMTTALLWPTASMAAPATDLEEEVVDLVNAARAEAGLPALTLAEDLVAMARDHSRTMATELHLHHNPSLGDEVDGWRRAGENVGRSPSLTAVNEAFLASPGHRANILDGDYTQIGIGVEVRDGTLWVTQVFRTPAGPLDWMF